MKRWLKSFSHAWRGLMFAYRHERNFRIHLFFAVVVAALAILFRINGLELALIILLVLAVLVLELVNSALEHFLDVLVPRFDVHAERVKNILAGAMLLVSIGAAVGGIILFLPHVLKVFT